ncbi:MAG: zf-HC2 domain-containing protein [Planctomycetes bacterium]|nr:zf-HC2 domain-containing protein [Planctomycetota bacterium]
MNRFDDSEDGATSPEEREPGSPGQGGAERPDERGGQDPASDRAAGDGLDDWLDDRSWREAAAWLVDPDWQDDDAACEGLAHQPPDPSDLVRYPPANARCAALRGMLRDYCDGELADAERRRVEEHVHGCRDCALALARAEREGLLLSRAFDEDRAAGEVLPESFARRVMAEVSAVVLEEHQTPSQLTDRVMERVRLENRRVPLWRRSLQRLGAVRVSVLAAAALVVAFVLGRASLGETPGVEATFTVSDAEGAVLVAAGDRRELRRGEIAQLAPGEMLELDESGSARLRLAASDPSAPGDAERVRVSLGGGDRVRALRGGGLELLDGAPRLAVGEPFTLTLPEGAVIEFDAGTYDVATQRVRRFDAFIAGSSKQLRIEVQDGLAELRRGGLDPLRVGAGKVLRLSGADVEFEELPSFELLARSSRVGTEARDLTAGVASASSAASWTGRVVDATSGRGIAGARIELLMRNTRIGPLASDLDGWFQFAIADASEAFVTVRAVAPRGGEVEYASFGPEPLPLGNRAQDGRTLRIALEPDLALRGVVVDERGAAVAAARVTPCVVDEVFALVDRHEDAAATTAADGSFALHGLPSTLGARQVLAILVEARGAPRVARLATREPGLADELRVVLGSARNLSLTGLPVDRQLRILQEVPGLPLAALADAFDVRSDARGRAELRGVGPGTLWLCEDESGELVRALIPGPDGSLVVSADAAAGRLVAQMRRLRSLARGFDAPHAAVAMAAGGSRFAKSCAVAPSGSASFLELRQDQQPVASAARVFIELANGEVAFVGDWDGRSALPFVAPAERPFRLFALGSNGSLGVLDSAAFDRGRTSIDVAPFGAAEVPEALRKGGDGLCVFELLDGPCAGQRFWRSFDPSSGYLAEGLLQGTYRVVLPDGRIAACTVAAGRAAQIAPVANSEIRR